MSNPCAFPRNSEMICRRSKNGELIVGLEDCFLTQGVRPSQQEISSQQQVPQLITPIVNKADIGISNARIQARQNHLRDAKWYAFDLDDTLHGFRKASAAAVTTVLRILNEQRHPESALEDLEIEYKRVLARGTASAFVDGKTSHQYRADRLQQVAQKCDIRMCDGQMEALLSCYERSLTENLELKPGALDLLKTLKRYGHMIAVITEGPQDAQERTVEALGLMPYIDYLATTNKLGVAKTDGLFVKVLEHLGLEPKEMVMTGDSWERDIVPATQAGMYCCHYTESRPVSDEVLSISGLDVLQTLVDTAHRCPGI